jgi:hypothetical protein
MYEYQTVIVEIQDAFTGQQLTTNFADDGWELITVVYVPHGYLHYFFKREQTGITYA